MQASKTCVAAAPESPAAPSDAIADAPDRGLELALVVAARAAVQLGVAEAVGLHEGEQLALAAGRGRPRPARRAAARGASSGPRSAASGAAAGVALRHHALDHPQHDRRVGRARRRRGRSARSASAIAACAHLAAEPCSPCALHAAGAQVGEELAAACAARRRLGPRAADVDAGVVVGAADADAAVGVDVDGGGRVELGRAGAVADLPDVEQLGEAPPVPRGAAAPPPRRTGARARRRSRARAGRRRPSRRRRRAPAATRGRRA